MLREVVATDTSMPLRAKRLGQGLADFAEADNCIAHDVSPIVYEN
jgi:hypothetical protein